MSQDNNSTPSLDFLRTLVSKRPGGEIRPQQEHMVEHVETAFNSGSHTLVQAGTGTGKSFGYLVPSILSDSRVTISTANIQLSEQLVNKDLPALAETYKETKGRDLSFSLLKGRSNYLCLRKLHELKSLDNPDMDTVSLLESLGEKDENREQKYGQAKEYAELYEWADETSSGDRSEAPAVTDKTWAGMSSTNAECPGRKICPFGNECFAEKARSVAKSVDIVVTNHALVGMDLNQEIEEGEEEKEPILGQRDVIIADEFHEFEKYLTDAWGVTITIKELTEMYVLARKVVAVTETAARDKINDLENAVGKLTEEAILMDMGNASKITLGFSIPMNFKSVLDEINRLLFSLLIHVDTELNKVSKDEQKKMMNHVMFVNKAGEITDSIDMFTEHDEGVVKWLEQDVKSPELIVFKAALLRIGEKFMYALHKRDMTFIGTSATITVAGSFDIPVRNLALNEDIVGESKEFVASAKPYSFLDVGTPFNFPKQAIMFIPSPNQFPAPVGKDRAEHSVAVDEYCVDSVINLGGHTLILSSTSSGAKRIAEALRSNRTIKKEGLPILLQNDKPAPQIIEEFKQVKNSTLIGTMGFWHGLDAPGDTLLHTIIDKIPFSPLDDPLMKARQEEVQKHGGNGFMDIYVSDANIKLAQGVGREIRHTTDRGVVSILDNRLISKAYGAKMLKSLPNMFRTSDMNQVNRSLKNLRLAP